MKPSKEELAKWKQWIGINRKSAACDLIDLSDATEQLIELVEEQQALIDSINNLKVRPIEEGDKSKFSKFWVLDKARGE